MAPAHPILLLLMAMTYWKMCATPWQEPRADDYTGSFNPVAWPDTAFVPLMEPRGVSGGEQDAESQLAPAMEAIADGMEISPGRAVPNTQLLPALEPRWYPRGPVRQRGNLGRRRYLQRFSHVPKTVTRENAVPEIDGEPVDEAAFQEGRSCTLPISCEDTEDVRAAGAPGKGHAESSVADGAGAEEPANGVRVKDVPMFSLKGALAVFVPLLLVTVWCCICVRRRRQKHQHLTGSTKAQRAKCAARERSLHPDREPAPYKAADRRTWQQQPPRVPGHPAWVPQSPYRSSPSRPENTLAPLPLAQPPWPPSPAHSTVAKQKKSSRPKPRWPLPPSPLPSSRGWQQSPWGSVREPCPTPGQPLLRSAVAFQIARAARNKKQLC
ncbi:uncharacterized protein LOC110388339 [Numida meleagris]|uniref:uncharacterized protein LOC110388339 n=1 Tax=Numida meleagris TaxID=8996 RepID=UPI000B3D9366|nr:uncharacterized protein LOC110388339 [Numida meleagris]